MRIFTKITIKNPKQYWLNYWSAYAGIPRQIWLLLLALLINRMGGMVIYFLSLYFHSKLNFSIAQVGLLLTLYGAGTVGGSFLGGISCDYIHPRKVVVLCFYTVSIMLIVLSFITSYSLLLLILPVYGLLVYSALPANNLMLNEYAEPHNRLKIFGLLRVIQNLGVSLAGITGGMVAAFDFNLVFYINAAATFAAAMTLYYVGRTQLLKIAANNKLAVIPFKTVFADRYFMWLWILVLLVLAILNQCLSTYPIYLHESYHISPGGIGLMFALNGILIVLVEVPLLNYLNRFMPLHGIAAVGAFIGAVGFGLLPFGSTLSFAVISVLIWTLGEIMTLPTSLTMALNHVEGISKGRYMAVYYAALSLANIVAPSMGTMIYHHFGGNTLWYVCLLLGTLLSFGYFHLPSPERRVLS